MKELTIEEKAKRYDEAIERAEKWRNAPNVGKIPTFANRVIEEIFPELADSEDERIRKWLINLVKSHTEWLEDRIKEQLSNGQVYGDELVKAKNSLAWLEKQGEKSTDKEMKETLRTEYEKGRADVIAEMQKSAWSEEDKTMVEDIIEAIDTQYAVTDYNEMVNWLKSLKDRVQPKVELTQLDKNILEAAIAFVEQNNHFNCWRGVDKHTVLSALYSLRPQNTWKPSYEQMNKLCWIANQNKDNMIGKELMSLYQDLKKLKGE